MAAIPAPVAPPSPSASGQAGTAWIQSAAWDAFWMFSALWGGVLLLVGSALETVFAAMLLLLGLQRLAATFHAWSTTCMVLFSPLLAEERRANRRRYLWLPSGIAASSLVLGVLVAATSRYPAHGAPGLGLWAFWLYIGSFSIGHFWHFGNQGFGVLSLYRIRAGQTRPIDRRVDKLYTVAMMYVIQPVVYLSLITTTAFSEMVATLLPLSPDTLAGAARLAVAAALLLSIGVIGFELSKRNRSVPRLLYLFVCLLHPVAPYAAVALGQGKLVFLYVFAYHWSHWLIAIGLVGRLNTRFYASRGDSTGRAILRHIVLLLLSGGLVLAATEPFKDYLLFSVDGFRYKELLAAITPGQTLVLGIALGFFLAEQLVHYYCDRCLFRFRNPDVRRRVGPLLLGTAPAR